MNQDTLQLLCDPKSKTPLQLLKQDESIVLAVNQETHYPVSDGIADFLQHEELSGTNKRYQAMYNRLSPLYNYVTRTAIMLMNTSEESVRMEYLRELEIKPGDKVLEVSVGTGTNIRLLPRHARYYGLDISPGQLRQCKKNLKKAGMEAELFLGLGERLPFCDNIFDVVFHMGGINFFNDPAQAIWEMYRVAKPGTKIVIVDETDRFTQKLGKIPIVKAFFTTDAVNVPDIHVPDDAIDIETKELFNGRLWYVGFRKPFVSESEGRSF
jgi:ubiquinone/menaquinone biosynthesis C-methylase UbiE